MTLSIVDITSEEILRLIEDENYLKLALYVESGQSFNVVLEHGPQGKFKSTPLVHAIRKSMFNMVRFLIENGADPNGYLDRTHPLQAAFYKKNPNMVNLLLSLGATLDTFTPEYLAGILATSSNDNDYILLEWMIKNGFKSYIDFQGTMGETALIRAVVSNSPKAVALLLQHGADPTIKDYAQDTLIAQNGVSATSMREFLELFKNRNPKMESALDRFNRVDAMNAIDHAVASGNTEIIALFADYM